MSPREITHTRSPEGSTSHEDITHVQGVDADGIEFVEPIDQVVQNIKAGQYYYIVVMGITLKVAYYQSPEGRYFIKTIPAT